MNALRKHVERPPPDPAQESLNEDGEFQEFWQQAWIPGEPSIGTLSPRTGHSQIRVLQHTPGGLCSLTETHAKNPELRNVEDCELSMYLSESEDENDPCQAIRETWLDGKRELLGIITPPAFKKSRRHYQQNSSEKQSSTPKTISDRSRFWDNETPLLLSNSKNTEGHYFHDILVELKPPGQLAHSSPLNGEPNHDIYSCPEDLVNFLMEDVLILINWRNSVGY
jgi:hypothetical protein